MIMYLSIDTTRNSIIQATSSSYLRIKRPSQEAITDQKFKIKSEKDRAVLINSERLKL